MKVDDMVREMSLAFEEVLGVKPTEAQRIEIEERVAQQFGGERVYVSKRAARPSIAPGDPIREIMRTYRVSYTTAWRMVRRRR